MVIITMNGKEIRPDDIELSKEITELIAEIILDNE